MGYVFFISLHFSKNMLTFIFSEVKNGISYYFFILGCVFFCLMFHCKLHTIKEPSSRNPLKSYSQHSLIGFFVMVFYTTIRLVYLTLDIHKKEDLVIDDHIFYLCNMVLFCILLPLYYINQVPTLKLYVSVYHHQPPPVLPWQVPEHFDPR